MQILRNAIFRVTRQRSQIISSIILSVLGLPALAICIKLYEADTTGADRFGIFCVLFGIVAAVQLGYTLCMGFRNAINIAPWLHDKNEVDTLLSLPQKRATGYLGGFLGGILLTVVPPALSAAVAAAIVAPAFPPEMSEQLVTLLFSGIVALVYYFSFVAGVSSFAARKGEAVSVPLVVMGILLLGATTGYMLINSGVIGIDIGNSFTTIIDDAGVFSPVGYIIYLFYHYMTIGSNALHFGGTEVVALIISAFWFFAGLLSVTMRRAENTGDAFAFKYGYHLFAFAGISAITMGAALELSIGEVGFDKFDGAFVLAYFLMTVIPFAISYVGYRGGFHKLLRGLAIYGGSVALSALVCLVLSVSGGFGATDYVPAAGDVKYVYTDFMGGNMPEGEYNSDIRYNNIMEEGGGFIPYNSELANVIYGHMGYNYRTSNYGRLVKFENRDTIEHITAEHRKVIEWEKNANRYLKVRDLNRLTADKLTANVPEYAGTTPRVRVMEVVYVLNSGKTVTREYRCDANLLDYSFNEIYYTAEVKDAVVNAITQTKQPFNMYWGGDVTNFRVRNTAKVYDLSYDPSGYDMSGYDSEAYADDVAITLTGEPQTEPASETQSTTESTTDTEPDDGTAATGDETAEPGDGTAETEPAEAANTPDDYEKQHLLFEDNSGRSTDDNGLVAAFLKDFKNRTAASMRAEPMYILRIQREENGNGDFQNSAYIDFYVTAADTNTLAYLRGEVPDVFK